MEKIGVVPVDDGGSDGGERRFPVVMSGRTTVVLVLKLAAFCCVELCLVISFSKSLKMEKVWRTMVERWTREEIKEARSDRGGERSRRRGRRRAKVVKRERRSSLRVQWSMRCSKL
ncbi:hypothetical protein K1719_031908 [Acacia pycnantha]|nr:hypothetical protein K1719_031908 [Acacia pycnantha]